MAKSNKPLVWGLFAAGGTITAFLTPVMIFVTALAVPLGIMSPEVLAYDRIHTFITGGGGGGLDTDADCTSDLPELIFREAAHHHMTVDLGEEEAIVRAVAIDGEEIDRVVLERVPSAD